MIKAWNKDEILKLWNEGLSASRIKEQLKLDITIRQIQRIGAKGGNRKLRRSGRIDEEFDTQFRDIVRQLMIERGDDPYLCSLCGVLSEKRMTIHHTKYDGATLSDLVFACMGCQQQFKSRGLA